MRLLARGALAAESTTERPLKAGATSRPEVVTAEMASNMLCAQEMDRAAKVMRRGSKRGGRCFLLAIL